MFGAKRQLAEATAYDVFGPEAETPIGSLMINASACRAPGDAIRQEVFAHYKNATYWIGHAVEIPERDKRINSQLYGPELERLARTIIYLTDEPSGANHG